MESQQYMQEEIQYMKEAGLTDEEIRSGQLDIFEHLATPTDKADVISIMRLLDIIPIMEQDMLDLLISKLKAQKLFKTALKARLKKMSSMMEFVNSEVWRTCDRSGRKDRMSQETWYMNLFVFSMKFSNALVNYIHNIELLSNASNAIDEHRRSDEIIEKATMISKLSPGDVFVFLDSLTFCEYTFKEMVWDEKKKEYSIYFCKVGNPNFPYKEEVPLYENRLWRPVIVMNILSKESIETLKKEAKQKSHRK